MFETKKTLIVVYKDELLMNQLRKMIETCDDTEGRVVGTKDGSINIVAWDEKVWLQNKKAGNIQGKILFLGDVKGTDKLIPVIDVQFSDSGVKYGWAGNQAVVFADTKALVSREDYDAFLKKFAFMPVPDFLKNKQGTASEPTTEASAESTETDSTAQDKEKKAPAFLRAAQKALSDSAETLGKMGNQVAEKSEELFRDRALMKRQMLFYGVVQLYNSGLSRFLNQ